MQKISWILLCCILVCMGAYRWGDMKWEGAKSKAMEMLYTGVSELVAPYIHLYEKNGMELVYEDVERFFVPLMSEFRGAKQDTVTKQKEIKEETVQEEIVNTQEEIQQQEQTEIPKEEVTETVAVPDVVIAMEKKVVINRTKLQEFDYLRQNFYQVDNTTTIGSDLLDATRFLEKDMTLKRDTDGPQILIYHTHSQEGYKDSTPGDPSTTVVGVGDYLEILLEENYGIEVLHHTGVYDLPERDNAYSVALPNIEKILQENPSIEVVIDLHRDGVAEDRHLVADVDGKTTAKLMFFNGLSRTTSQGELTYLPNPYVVDNLALSFQLHLTAEEYYPGLMRKIYLKGYRYNLHLIPKSILVEVGAQTNTLEEARNAMEPLANILAMVLLENDSTNDKK